MVDSDQQQNIEKYLRNTPIHKFFVILGYFWFPYFPQLIKEQKKERKKVVM